ncbi:hypothetical protein HAZT_HAZT008792 [Hyalella azteca]|uniref:Polyprenal reductase n=1 Tax=Hyalella azteca TaxID=294128 RepID=A0A6A0GVT6_HYAAZ|nr:polyprenol reductase [Hyalella azteca]KAA0190146.1 hypothetical protein HAZT_HAZT008792 [Hyalella azteca]
MNLFDIVLAVNWPAAFYLASAGIVVVLEPIASSSVPWLPSILQKSVQTFLGFGKTLPVKKHGNSWWIRFMTVPKSWFGHFYVVSSSVGLLSCFLLYIVYGRGVAPPSWVFSSLDLLTSPRRQPSDSSLLSVTSVVLLTVQCCARFYECYFVSVFSSSAVMNVLQYAVGFLHYISAFTLLLSHTPALVSGGSTSLVYTTEEVAFCIACSFYFGLAFAVQRDSIARLARLRKEAKLVQGRAGSYVLPVGGAFEYVSCPHMSAEVIMYTALFALHRNAATAIMWLFVFSNQVHVALSNHRWYRSIFADYPLSRRAICPGLL